MLIHSQANQKRQGGIAPLTAIMMVVILAMVAFAVDISYLVLTASELQNVADSAALAGANKLGDNFVLYSLPTQSSTNKTSLRTAAIAAAVSSAKTYSTYNNAGGVSITLLDADIETGFTDATGKYTSSASDSSKYPNTVKVVARRDSSANTPLGLFFAPVLGVSKMNMTASATATLYTGTLNSLKVSTVSSGVLPVALDVNDWNNFLKTGQDRAGAVNTDTSGNPLLQIYGTIKDTGDFGLLSLNDSHAGASTVANWISNGVSPTEIQTLVNNKLLPLSSHDPNLWDWAGDTGFKASNAMDINAQVGKTYLLPLFTPYSNSPYSAGVGNGSGYNFNIVQFVGVKIMPTNQTNKEVWIQPVVVNDPNQILTGITPADTTSSTFATSTLVKLTK